VAKPFTLPDSKKAKFHCAILFSVLCISAEAASVVSPNALATVEGNKVNSFPFNLTGYSSTLGNQRYQQVYSAADFSAFAPGGELITNIAFRPAVGNGGAFTSTLPAIRIDLSTTTANPDGLASNFLANAGADNIIVFGGTNGSPLALSSVFVGPTNGPKNFDIVINLTKPFFYNPAAGNLLLDVRNFGAGTTTFFDAYEALGDSISRGFTCAGIVDPACVSDVSSPSADVLQTLGLITRFNSVAPVLQAPVNDNFTNRLAIAGTNVSFSATNFGATREPNEPTPYASSNSIWYSWIAPAVGGVELTATYAGSDFPPFASPIVAVYSGNTLGTLRKLASNTVPFSAGGNPLSEARVVFTAVAGAAYQIQVDGLPLAGYTNQGPLNMTLRLSPPPANDLFSNATVISGIFYEITNSFIGANRETGEPSHGDTNLQQTLWWNWTAPTNLGAATIPVRLTADGVSFPPGIGVYIGNSVTALTNVISSQQTNVLGANAVFTNGMTSMAVFSATAGTTYHIALAGLENNDGTILTNFGTFRFRLNCKTLGVSILNLITTNNPDSSITFGADALLQNFGTNASNPLQVSVSAISGGSMRGTGGTISNLQIFETNFPAPPVSLGSGQNKQLHFTGMAPAPLGPNPGDSTAQGWGVYAQLQEQPPGITSWFTIDEVLVLFGNWPSFSGVAGPGGGVIRLDPYYTGTTQFVPFPAVLILGTNRIEGTGSATYVGRATFSTGTNVMFTNTAWSAIPANFPITTNGLFTPPRVISNTVATVACPYSFEGFVSNATLQVTVLAPPTFTSFKLVTNGGLSLTLNGNPGRTNVIEASTNVAPPFTNWVPLATNAATNWNFIDFSRTNFARRFYRAREL
jgi:hypothetical protein